MTMYAECPCKCWCHGIGDRCGVNPCGCGHEGEKWPWRIMPKAEEGEPFDAVAERERVLDDKIFGE